MDDQSRFTPRQAVILVGAITLFALAMRLFRLDVQSLWYDEGFSVYLSRMDLTEITARTAHDIQPPLYYYLLHFWMALFGTSEFVVRALSLVFGVLTVPVMFAIGKRLFDTRAGVIAAAITALSPLYLWYSQEARMYTLLTFLGLAAGYFLITLLMFDTKSRTWLWVGYAAAGILALYTHYFAAFLLAALAVFFVIVWLQRRNSRLLVEAIIAYVIIVAAYLPWIPFVVKRFGEDVSYWKGTLKLDEALRHIAISFTTGESALETIAIPLAAGFAALLMVAIVAIAWRKQRLDSLIFLLCYLLIPLALIVGLSYRNPKFEPRYLMLASPAVFLLLAGGIAALWDTKGRLRSAAIIATAVLAFYTLGVFVYADFNAYFDPAFTKDDFRGVARYIEQHIGPDEDVILASGHLFPVFTYYYHRGNWHAIPNEPTLSTEHVLDFSLADELNRDLAGKRGVWTVLWQDQVVDPNGFLPMFLETVGQERKADASFWGVKLRHYVLPADAHFASQPQVQHPAEANFAGKIKLLGFNLPADPPPADRGAAATLFWQVIGKLDDDYKISLRLRDEQGHAWGRIDRRPAGYLYPTPRWKPGEFLFGKYELPLVPGTPPGSYQLEVGFYTDANPAGLDVLDAAGAPAGKTAILGPVAIARATQSPSADQLTITHPLRADLGAGIELLGYDIARDSAQPGDALLVTILLRATKDVADNYLLRLQLAGHGGENVAPVNAFPTSQWRAGDVVRGQYDFTVPVEATAGAMRLQVALVDASGSPVVSAIDLASLKVEATERQFARPQPKFVQEANFGNSVRLLGYDLDTTTVKPGATFHLALYWQPIARMSKSYTVFVHLLDANSKIWAQRDSAPKGGARPTTGWVTQEFIADSYELTVDAGAPAGDYVLEVGMYDAGSPAFPRLSVIDANGKPGDNRVLLGTSIRVSP